jgi:hypothetical protein
MPPPPPRRGACTPPPARLQSSHQVVVVVPYVAEALYELAEHPVARHEVVDRLKRLGSTQLDARGVAACRHRGRGGRGGEGGMQGGGGGGEGVQSR